MTWTPHWLQLGGEIRGRIEGGNAFDSGSIGKTYMNRLRFDMTIKPLPWMRFFIEGQDARALGLSGGQELDGILNPFDIHQAYAELGSSEAGWLLRAGRQAIAIGDERFVGADSALDPIGQVFDAVRVDYAKGRVNATTFVGLRVEPNSHAMDRYDSSNRIAGLSVQIKTRGDDVVEPYVMWKHCDDTVDLMGNPGRRDVVAPGIRAQGNLPRSLEYSVEMAIERGDVLADRMSAWAGHWELDWRPLGKDSRVRLATEYTFASGDNNPSDGKHGTFDDMYQASFNKYGTSDPFAWRNIRYPSISVEVQASKRWSLNAGYRRFWLATAKDGVYPGGDEYMVRNADATSSFLGSHALVSATYKKSARWQFGTGYGYLFPGEYLRQSGYHSPLKTAYVQTSFGF
jgi:hypothetical protein